MVADVEKTIREYLPTILHMSLATCADDQPWVCEVHFAYDKELNLYFRSLASRRHSQEITQNNRVAGNMVTQHELTDRPRGVYFEGTAELLEKVDKDSMAFKAFVDRFNADEAMLEDARKEDGHKIYKITVKNFYLFDSRESSPSQKYTLPWKV